MEIWKDVKGYEGLYQVSNLGRVKSLPKEWFSGHNTIRKHNGKFLKLVKGNTGYYTVNLYKNGHRKLLQVHQLVAISFLNHTPNGYETVIDHINEDRLDNRVENLQIVTQRFNISKGKRNKHGYTGVYSCGNKFRAQYQVDGKNKKTKGYDTPEEASAARLSELQRIER